jgi:hypothetical protein
MDLTMNGMEFLADALVTLLGICGQTKDELISG